MSLVRLEFASIVDLCMYMYVCMYRCLADAVKILQNNLNDDLPGFDMMVRRDHVLTDAFKRMARLSFDPKKRLIVS